MVQKVILVPIIWLENLHCCGFQVLTHDIYQMHKAVGDK